MTGHHKTSSLQRETKSGCYIPLESQMNKLSVDVYLKFVRKMIQKISNFEVQYLCYSHFEKKGAKVSIGSLVFFHSNHGLLSKLTLETWSKHSHQHDTSHNQETDHLSPQKKNVICVVQNNLFEFFSTLLLIIYARNTS
mgnify:CR=1 FL=1